MPTDLRALRQFGVISPSPDSQLIAVEVRRPNMPGLFYAGDDEVQGTSDVWIVQRRTGIRVPLHTRGSAWDPLWSPSGVRLAYLEALGQRVAHLRIWERRTRRSSSTSEMGVDLRARVFQTRVFGRSPPMLWLDDSTLVSVLLPEGVTSVAFDEMTRNSERSVAATAMVRDGRQSTAVSSSTIPSTRDDSEQTATVVVINTRSGGVRSIGSIPLVQTRLARQFVVIAPGRRDFAIIAHARPATHQGDRVWLHDMYPARFAIGSLDNRSGGLRWANQLTPYVDGSSQDRAWLAWDRHDSVVAVVCAAAADDRRDSTPYIAVVQTHPMTWHNAATLTPERFGHPTFNLGLLTWTDSHEPLVLDAMQRRWWAVSGDSVTRPVSPDSVHDGWAKPSAFDVSEDGRLIETGPTGLEHTILPSLNSNLARVPDPKYEDIEYTTNGDDSLHATALLPYGYEPGKRYPTVVVVYGGAVYHQVDHFAKADNPSFFNMLLLAGHGYLVLLPSMPLPSYGSAGDPLTHLYDGVGPAIDRAVSLGLVDSTRLGLIGESYGGYSVYGILTQSSRFKAAVAINGISDLVSMYGTMDVRYRITDPDYAIAVGPSALETAQERMGAAPWEDPARYLRNSPLFYADRVSTPLLILHGDIDFLGTQDEEFFTALWRLNKQARFVRYLGEGHGLVSGANIEDAWRRIFAWFDRYLLHPTQAARSTSD
jgi:acetyl esterase/lipase